MKYYSRYNVPFYSRRFGYFLYNTLSNTLLKLDENYYKLVEALKNNTNELVSNDNNQFYLWLKENGILVEEKQEEELLLARQKFRDSQRYNKRHLTVIICPTLGCNFRCHYCFQQNQQDKIIMDSKTCDKLLEFIKNFSEAKSLSVVWYGGEPTLAFDKIRIITAKIKKLDIEFKSATIITNGFQLNQVMIDEFNELNIKAVQITLDGPKEIHNARRVLPNGKGTFQQIMDNVDLLLNSSYEGECLLRINIDNNNKKRYLGLRTDLLSRYKNKRIKVYCAQVVTSLSYSYTKKCELCSKEWFDFTLAEYQKNRIPIRNGLFPNSDELDVCFSNSCSAFFIGPEGELYKCSEDLGRKEMVVGNIFDSEQITNKKLLEFYMMETDPHLDSECKNCKVLPICGGGCANRRLREKLLNESGLEYCSRYKENLIEYLEEYFNEHSTIEICKNLSFSMTPPKEEKGYKVVKMKKGEWFLDKYN